MAMITAEVLGLEIGDVRPSVADTDSIGHTDVTGGSRTTLATGRRFMTPRKTSCVS
jgi:xanthine dehydrogenase molybdenum-binding subunit